MPAWFQSIGQGLGRAGSEWGEAVEHNTELALSVIKNKLVLQEIQQRIRESQQREQRANQPQPYGIVPGQGGAQIGVTFDQNKPQGQQFGQQTVVPGIDPQQFQKSISSSLDQLPPEIRTQAQLAWIRHAAMNDYQGGLREIDSIVNSYQRGELATGKEPTPIFKGDALVGIKDPRTNRTYTASDLETAPPWVRKQWTDITQQVAGEERRKETAKVADENRRFQQQLDLTEQRFQTALKANDYKAARREVNKAKADYDTAIDRQQTMDKNLADIYDEMEKTGKVNQQAMLSLVANHIGMTLGAQKGARITRAVWEEAVQSSPWLARAQARFSGEGLNAYLTGVVLTDDQMRYMVDLAHEKVQILNDHVGRVKQEYADDLGVAQGASSTSPRQPKSAVAAPVPSHSSPKTADEYLGR